MDDQIERRYRYKKHSQKIKEIDVHIANRIQEIKLIPDNYEEDQIGNLLIKGSFFYDELESQRSENFSPEYTEFYIKIVDESQNLPLILNNLNMIVDQLLSHLDHFPFEMLNLIKNICRDCQTEIYPLFCQKILIRLVNLLQIEKL